MRRTTISIILASLLTALALPSLASGMRGLWVDAFHPGFRNPTETAKMVARAKACGFNALFVQVRRRGDVFYKSGIEPMAKEVQLGYDPLADIIEKAHAAGIEVHAWLTIYEVYHDSKWNETTPGQVHAAHPEWLTKDNRGRAKFPDDRVFLDPGLPEVRGYLANLIGEVIDGYAVDGIHLDALKYPNAESGYNEASIAKFNQEKKTNGTPKPDDKAWSDWRRAQLTEFVRTAKERVKESKRDVMLSASVMPNRVDGIHARFQDWVAWVKAGLLDFAVPMVFEVDDRVFESVLADVLKAAGPKNVYIGQGGWQLPTDRSVHQIDLALSAGAPGVVVYSYNYCRQKRTKGQPSLMDALKGESLDGKTLQ